MNEDVDIANFFFGDISWSRMSGHAVRQAGKAGPHVCVGLAEPTSLSAIGDQQCDHVCQHRGNVMSVVLAHVVLRMILSEMVLAVDWIAVGLGA